jgi:hypothetical protein
MGQRWLAFSERARAESAVRAGFISLALFGAFLLPAAGSWAQTGGRASVRANDRAPAAEASPGLDQDFLLLPVFDIERVGEGKAAVLVGDSLTLKVANVSIPGLSAPVGSLQIAVPENSGEDLQESGWDISQQASPQGSSDLVLGATPLKSGNLTLPSLALKTADGKNVGRTNPFRLTVASAIKSDDKKPEEAEPPAPPSGIPFPFWFMAALIGLGVAILLAIVILLMRYLRTRGRKTPVVPAAPPKPEDEVALSELTTLEGKRLCAAGKFKSHYFTVSEVLKNYIGARYDFNAPECTSGEVIGRFENNQWIAPAQVDGLESLFTRLDRVKFTDHIPNPNEGKELLEAARQFVISTRKIRMAAGISQGTEVKHAP